MVLSKKQIIFISCIFCSFIFIIGILVGVIAFDDNHIQKVVINSSSKSINNPISKNAKLFALNKPAQIAIPSVVNISTPDIKGESSGLIKFDRETKPFLKKEVSLGSGIIVASNGYIVTNNHVIDGRDKIKVSLSDKRNFWAKVIGQDPKSDLAVLKIDAKHLIPIKFCNSGNARVGDIVLAVGNPFGLGETVTMGIISAIGRSNIGLVDYEDFIQTDAAVNPGNSGGALVNASGELIGMNTAIVTKSGGYEGIGFSIPSNMVKRVFKDIINYKRVQRGWIGIAIQEINSDIPDKINYNNLNGVVIIDIIPDSPAMIAGLKQGDIITGINKIDIRDKGQLRNLIAQFDIGKQIILTVFRGGQKRQFSVKITKLPEKIKLVKFNNYKFPAK